MKRLVYYFSFTTLGIMIGFFLHMIIEIAYIKLLLIDFNRYGMGLSWSAWESVHGYGTAILILLGAGLGYWLGIRCWKWLYVDQRLLKRWGIRLKENF